MRTIDEYVAYAEANGYALSKNHARVIDRIVEKGGFCPCRLSTTPDDVCPCASHHDDIKNNGRCQCGLFESK